MDFEVIYCLPISGSPDTPRGGAKEGKFDELNDVEKKNECYC